MSFSAKEVSNASGRLVGTSLDCLTSIVENLRQGYKLLFAFLVDRISSKNYCFSFRLNYFQGGSFATWSTWATTGLSSLHLNQVKILSTLSRTFTAAPSFYGKKVSR